MTRIAVRVMADLFSSGIWQVDEEAGICRHWMLEHESLNLSVDLSTQLYEWIEYLSKEQKAPKEYDQGWMITRGRELAFQLKRELGPEVQVLYASLADERVDEVILLDSE